MKKMLKKAQTGMKTIVNIPTICPSLTMENAVGNRKNTNRLLTQCSRTPILLKQYESRCRQDLIGIVCARGHRFFHCELCCDCTRDKNTKGCTNKNHWISNSNGIAAHFRKKHAEIGMEFDDPRRNEGQGRAQKKQCVATLNDGEAEVVTKQESETIAPESNVTGMKQSDLLFDFENIVEVEEEDGWSRCEKVEEIIKIEMLEMEESGGTEYEWDGPELGQVCPQKKKKRKRVNLAKLQNEADAILGDRVVCEGELGCYCDFFS